MAEDGVRPEDLETYRRLARAFGGQLKRRVKTTCAVCGKPIESTLRQGQPYRRYCSPACSARAYYRRKREEVLQRQKARRRKKAQQEGEA
jgi:hypothetical protein